MKAPSEQDALAFYREAYEKTRAHADALEKSNTRLYEQEALHTESYGIVCAERDRAVNALSDEIQKRQSLQAAFDMTENGRLDAIGELRIVREQREEAMSNLREYIADKRRLARELGEAIGWDAPQPSLCDLIHPASELRTYAEKLEVGMRKVRDLIVQHWSGIVPGENTYTGKAVLVIDSTLALAALSKNTVIPAHQRTNEGPDLSTGAGGIGADSPYVASTPSGDQTSQASSNKATIGPACTVGEARSTVGPESVNGVLTANAVAAARKVVLIGTVLECGCSVAERHSGHRVDCQSPYLREALDALEVALDEKSRHSQGNAP